MRRKSERSTTKKSKASPEKIEKPKRSRTRRRKQSASSENESGDEASPVQNAETVEQEKAPTSAPAKDESPEDTQQEVWHVKTPDTSSDIGEIQKLKLCLSRPSSTPERADKSPRSKRKHSRATSSSDSPSVESASTPEKKKKHRNKKSRDSKDENEINPTDSQEEPDAEQDTQKEQEEPENEVTQSTEDSKLASQTSDEAPMSTTNVEIQEIETVTESKMSQNDSEGNNTADTTVVSPQVGSQEHITDKKSPEAERERSTSIEKSEVLEIHVDDNKQELLEKSSLQKEHERSRKEDRASSKAEVSIRKDKKKRSKAGEVESDEKYSVKSINKNDVVEGTHSDENKRIRNVSTDSDKDKDGKPARYRSGDIEKSDSGQAAQEDIVQNGQAPPIVVSRKRKWGARPKITKQKSITISTDILKDIIPDVKPVEFDEVIEERKPKRVEVAEKLEKPILPKIVIDNTQNVEQIKKEKEADRVKEPHMANNRRISIVKDDDCIIAKPPSPPRFKQSNILYITNLVRPFTLPQLKNLLQRTGRIMENGFWIDRIKSKCYVKYENEDQAVETRHALHGVTWPVSNPKALQVDFSTEEAFEKAMKKEEADAKQASAIPGTVEDWLREQDIKRERGELEKPWERKAATREWDLGKNEKDKGKEKRRDERPPEKRRHRSLSPEPARKFKKKEDEAPAKLLDDLFRKTKTTPCIYWLPLSAETIAIKEEQRRKHMAEHERRLQELRRPSHRRH